MRTATRDEAAAHDGDQDGDQEEGGTAAAAPRQQQPKLESLLVHEWDTRLPPPFRHRLLIRHMMLTLIACRRCSSARSRAAVPAVGQAVAGPWSRGRRLPGVRMVVMLTWHVRLAPEHLTVAPILLIAGTGDSGGRRPRPRRRPGRGGD